MAHAQIAVGLMVLRAEHTYDEETLTGLIGDTMLTPPGRFPLLLRGLLAGFDLDFTVAVHLIIPQLEAGLRHIAAQNGTVPRNISANGVEEAWGFDRLLSERAVTEVLGERLTFELRSLLIDDFGPKLRHNVAHGLIPDNALKGLDALYAWWLALRLAVLPSAKFQAYAETGR